MSGWIRAGLVVGLVSAVVVLQARWAVEASNRTVEIVLDGPDWTGLARREGRAPHEVFAAARERGATAVAVYEQTLARLAEAGEVLVRAGGEVMALARSGGQDPVAAAFGPQNLRPDAVYVTGSPDQLAFVERAFTDLLGSGRVRRVRDVLEVSGVPDDLEQAPLGYRPEDLAAVRALGLRPVLRLRNYPGMTADALRARIGRLPAGGGAPVVFELQEVLGYEGLLPEAGAALAAAGYTYGRIEVFNIRRKQRGEDRLAAVMRPAVIRLFSLTPDELLAASPQDNLDKFVRAARERNIRILYLRPLQPTAGVSGVALNLEFVGRLSSALRRVGLRPGPARPLDDPAVSPAAWLGVVAGGAAAAAWGAMVLGRAAGVPAGLWAPGGAAAVVAFSAVLVPWGPPALWRQGLALLVACLVPVVAVAAALPRGPRRHPVAAALGSLWKASAVSAAGGVVVAALLTGWEFMMASRVFVGVKLAHIVPVVLVAAVAAAGASPPRHWREFAARIWAWSDHPLRVRYAVAVLVVGLAAVVLLGRSGNFGLPVPAAEERMREWLEDTLVARPRTKEYLLGHPALVLAALCAARGWRPAAVALAAAGAVGQASIINSFAHIHTPLLYTLWRTANGLVLGSALGAAVAAAVARAGSTLARRGSRPPS
ncbi:MAG: DUF5693 family protein [Armatimonadota bacterium]|nr:DUF5693 family protein [Armatimonadota bacterium]MDR7612589.1 DUF5693 family protein [Armatimonadota bacterium]